MSIFQKIGAWFAKVFKGGLQDADKVAITVTEGVKTALSSGIVGFLAQIADTLLKSQVPTELVSLIQEEVPKVLAVELAIQGLPASPTEQDILTFEQAVLGAFGVTSNSSKLWTVLAAQVYGLIQAQLQSGTKLTFAQCVIIVETAYSDYLADQQQYPNS